MHVTDITLDVKWLCFGHILTILNVFHILKAVVVSPHSSFGWIKSTTATRNVAIKPAPKWCCCNSPAFRFCLLTKGYSPIHPPAFHPIRKSGHERALGTKLPPTLDIDVIISKIKAVANLVTFRPRVLDVIL